MSESSTSKYPLGAIAFWFSFIAGVGIWMASPTVTGHSEPWDSSGSYYVGTMLLSGLICGAIAPRRIWLSWLGMYAGQVLGLLLSSPQLGSLAPLGLLCVMPLYCLVTVVGVSLAAVLRLAISAMANRKPVSEA